MSVSRLLRAERMARKSARRKMPDGLSVMEQLRHIAENGEWGDLVRDMEATYPPLVMKPLPPPESPPDPAVELPAPTPPSRVTAEVEQPRAWHEDYYRWRQRTAADDAEDAESDDELDDPLGIYS
jgi:hypothetical protein